MGSGKSLDCIRACYNYKERGMDVLVYKSKIDNRDGEEDCFITSRTGAKIKAEWIDNNDNLYNKIHKEISNGRIISCIFLDEINFLSEKQIEMLWKVTLELKIPVICYGLSVDFTGKLFPSVSRLLALADEVEEIKSVCWCGKKSKFNARLIDGKITKHGELIQVGGNESYISLCSKHFYNKQLK